MPGGVWEYPEDPSTIIPQLGKSMEEIADDWIKFFFFVDKKDHTYSQNDWSFDRRLALDGRQRAFYGPGNDPKTWFLLPGKVPGFHRTNLPDNRIWAVMFSPYMTAASTVEFPSIRNGGDLRNFVMSDTDRVYRLEASINGETLTTVRIKRDVEVNIVANSVIDNTGASTAQVYYDGQFVLLKPLPLGETIITSRGYSPNFENDVRYSVYTRRLAEEFGLP
jgi:hypothetical protein